MALLFFLPLLIASGGNAGAQSATLMVRALATGDVRMSDWASVLGREFATALLLGLTMAAAVSLIGVLRAGPDIALVVALSMVAIVLVGAMIGMSLPFVPLPPQARSGHRERAAGDLDRRRDRGGDLLHHRDAGPHDAGDVGIGANAAPAGRARSEILASR